MSNITLIYNFFTKFVNMIIGYDATNLELSASTICIIYTFFQKKNLSPWFRTCSNSRFSFQSSN